MKKVFLVLLIHIMMLSGCGSGDANEVPSEDGTMENRMNETEVVNASNESPQEQFSELAWNSKVVNLQMADVTYDGVQDYIITKIWTLPEVTTDDPVEMLMSAGVGYVEVYDGRMDFNLDNSSGTKPLWEQEFASAHAGNVQVSVVHRDEFDYILVTNVYSMMGSYVFDYKVFSLDDKGQEQVADEFRVAFETIIDKTTYEQLPISEAQKQEITDFRERLTPWLSEGTLLVATDVDLDRDMVTTPERVYTSKEYYDQVWVRYLD